MNILNLGCWHSMPHPMIFCRFAPSNSPHWQESLQHGACHMSSCEQLPQGQCYICSLPTLLTPWPSHMFCRIIPSNRSITLQEFFQVGLIWFCKNPRQGQAPLQITSAMEERKITIQTSSTATPTLDRGKTTGLMVSPTHQQKSHREQQKAKTL